MSLSVKSGGAVWPKADDAGRAIASKAINSKPNSQLLNFIVLVPQSVI
jgi:hypothetical protein